MTTLLLPGRKGLAQRHNDHRFHSNERTTRDLELSMEDLGIRRNDQLKCDLRGIERLKFFLESQENRKVECFGSVTRKLYDRLINIYIQHQGPNERTILANKVARSGLVETLTEFYDFVRNSTNIQGLTDLSVTKNESSDDVKLLLTIRKIFFDFSVASDSVIKRLADTDFQRALMADLRHSGENLKNLETCAADGDEMSVLTVAMVLLYRCVRHPHTKREVYRQAGIFTALAPFLYTNLQQFKLRAVLILAYTLVDDVQIMSKIKFDLFQFLLEAINETSLAKDKCLYDCTIPELIDAVTALHGSYPDKAHFIKKGPLSLIVGCLEAGNQDEVHAAVKLVLELSFWEPNRDILRRDESLMDSLYNLAQANDQNIRFTTRQTLFVLNQHERRVKEILSGRTTVSSKHILLSYHMSDQAQVLQIYQALTADGYSVWIDVAEMNKYSNVLDAIITAVDQSSLIVVCFSENYVTDLSCRLVAEYAFALKKRIVPLKLQSGYKPRGWLTSVIGSKFYLTLTNESSFEKQMNTLRVYIQGASTTLTADAPLSRAVSRALLSRGQSRGQSRAFSRATSRVTSRGQNYKCPVYEKNVIDWDEDDVILWATQFKLEGRAWKVVSNMSVQQILRVYHEWKKSPETFYHWVETVIGLGSIEDLMRFRNAIRSLKDYV